MAADAAAADACVHEGLRASCALVDLDRGARRRQRRPAASSRARTHGGASMASIAGMRVEPLPGPQQPRPNAPAGLARRRRRPKRVDLIVELAQGLASGSRETPSQARLAAGPSPCARVSSTSVSTHARTTARVGDLPGRGGRLKPVGVRVAAGRKQAVAEVQQRRQTAVHRSVPMVGEQANGCERPEARANGNRVLAKHHFHARGNRRRRSRVRSTSRADGCCRSGSRRGPTRPRVRGSTISTGSASSTTVTNSSQRVDNQPIACAQAPCRAASAVPNSAPPSERRRPRAFSRSSQPSVMVSRA